jgi:hypothetical protein
MFRADFPGFTLKIVEHSHYLLEAHAGGGKLAQSSDKSNRMIDILAQ